jgi:predicted ATPase/class 3 adenylate cyclase
VHPEHDDRVRELPRGTVTFLFTDIEGSTRLLHELGDGYASALAKHRRVLQEAFARHGGVEVDTQGDAFFYAFADARQAVAAAAGGQTALERGPILVRMGLHSGSPELADEGYVGLDVHLGARVAAAGHGGQVLLSKATRELVDGEVLDLGEHRLKDFGKPVWIFQLGERRFPPLKTISNTNLPRPASAFIGRERERAELVSLLKQDARLLTLTGPGGSGKTRLAIEAAAELVPEFKNGVFWVGVASLRDPALVLDTISQTLGAKVGLAEHVGERELLLLLDNLEQVVAAAPELATLVESCPNLHLLVTSRELLRVRGEVEYAVLPLADAEAVELFCSRATVAGNEEVEELCRRLDNLPLAIELAAARVKVLSPRQLVERLSQRLDLLRGGRDADARQQTLRATIAWSHDLLGATEQRSFARLAVFSGGCALEAAEEVCEADVEALQSLVDKSLLRRTNERFWMLETIREFAAERLHERGEHESLARRHAEWQAELAERLEKPLRDGDPDATARLTAELENMRSGLDWLARHGEVAQAIRIVDGLWYFWVTRALVTEGLRWARWVVAEAPKAPPEERALGLLDASELFRFFGDPDQALSIKRELLPQLRELSPERHYPSTLADMADMLAEAREFEEARRLGGEAVALRRRLGVRSGIGHALSNLGMVEFRAGNFVRARDLNEEALTLFEEPYVPTKLALAALLAGESARRAGDLSGALPLLLRALHLCQKLGQRGVFPELLQEIAAASGRHADAVRLLGAAERLLGETGMPRWDPDDYEHTVTALRAKLGTRPFEEAWVEGVTMPEDEALALAARCLD